MFQRHSAIWLLCVAFVLSACSPAPEPLPTSAARLPSPTASAQSPALTSTTSAREAELSELIHDVQARLSAQGDLQSAREGERLGVGGQVRTGAESKARLDLTEGTILRLGPDSEFTVVELNPDPADPFTRLTLLGGKLWVILFGGELEVETPVGVATVRGSYLSVDFDPVTNTLVVTCLEGQCALSNARGTLPLTSGQWSQITGPGGPPSPPQPMTQNQVQVWTQINPEAQQILPEVFPQGTPTPGAPPLPPVAGTLPPPPNLGTPAPPTVVSTGPLHYSLTNNCPMAQGTATVAFAGPQTENLTIATGATRAGDLPAGKYNVTVKFADGRAIGPFPVDSASGPLQRGLCDAAAPGGTPGQPPSGGSVNTQPLRYTLHHNCPTDPQTGVVREGTWEWTFENLTTGQTYSVSLQPGDRKEGEFPPGHYRVSDRDATGPLKSGEMDSDGPAISVARCQQP